jgi:AcrR family transcriptional regulator
MNEKLEKRILDVTIEVCAHNEPGVFSTRLIAKKADTSEGTIFLHFRNKRNLIFAAERQMGTELIAASQVITANAPTFQDFYSGCVDYVLKRPDWVAFINTYSHVFPRPKDDYGEGSYINRLLEAGEDSIRKYFPSVSAAALLRCVSFSYRELFRYAQLVLNGDVVDPPRFRELESNLVLHGLSHYVEK